MALLIDAAYELFGLLRRAWIDMAQQTIQRERAGSDQVGRILDGLWRHAIHLDHHFSAPEVWPDPLRDVPVQSAVSRADDLVNGEATNCPSAAHISDIPLFGRNVGFSPKWLVQSDTV
jgi:hypothetical protein